ncbi:MULTISPECIES: class I SAM-dependent methyltransferase [Cellulomonas]|uniref:2-polyprenyl-3-methyl-5-hydroxy-6-metoxy-1, 4-benzoquinol methylase n=1 Tax=Cellulomonas iranensis TaxID=76862 RepID=A0ABU0GMB0_9CELL|nr:MULTISPECIES: class I SAM-dependent methyltransferase [Cellulomonas]MDQ0426491.1 2-polyprenyl-3-methyl-5-hydroxy-6-metoxy-1,4-benzoquinol methylase [Cellulomonas iranensis]UCN15893.1 class I SAM-dependent methyltransferase [Cellulomonas iranensis]
MSQYDTTLDLSVSNTSHAQVVSLVPAGSDVLDVGCATGYLAEALNQRGCTVSGVEYDAEAAEKARPHLDHLVVGDLNTMDVDAALGGRTFDVLVLADVLEHVLDPVDVLRRLLPLLRPGGSVVMSIPNVAHGSLRLALLQGRWQYTDVGLLDRTHIRFFTRRSVLELLADTGLAAAELRTTTRDPLTADVEIDADALPEGVVDWVRAQEDAMTFQFVLRAVRDDAEASLGRAVAEREALRSEVAALRRSAELAHAQRDAAVASLREVQGTRAWRLLRVPRALYGKIRGGAR